MAEKRKEGILSCLHLDIGFQVFYVHVLLSTDNHT